VLVLDRKAVERLLDPDSLLAVLAAAHKDLSAAPTSMPLKVGVPTSPPGGMLVTMPAHVPSAGALGAKLMAAFSQNPSRGLPYTQGMIAIFDETDGAPIAVLDATHITAMRTAAGSALATQLLARPDAHAMAILGTGRQARMHARMMVRVRPITEIRVAGRDARKAAALADELAAELKVRCLAAETFEAAGREADIVCGTTHSANPVIERRWVSAGMHINSVGLNRSGREVDAETIRDAVLVVEHRASILSPTAAGSNDINWAIRDGAIDADHIHAELGELLLGTKSGRTSPLQITLYKSVGVAVQDVAAAGMVVRLARERGVGLDVTI